MIQDDLRTMLGNQIDSIINDMYRNKIPVPLPEQTPINLKTILFLFKSTNSNPILLQKMTEHFLKSRPNGSGQIFITKKQLLDQLCNPDISVYSSRDSQFIYNTLRNPNTGLIQVENLIDQGENRDMVQSGRIRKSLSRDEFEKIVNLL